MFVSWLNTQQSYENNTKRIMKRPKSYNSINQKSSLLTGSPKKENKFRILSVFLALVTLIMIIILISNPYSSDCENDDDNSILALTDIFPHEGVYITPQNVLFNNSECSTKYIYYDDEDKEKQYSSKSKLLDVVFATGNTWNDYSVPTGSSSYELDLCLDRTYPIESCRFYIYPNNEYTFNLSHYAIHYRHDSDYPHTAKLVDDGNQHLQISVRDCYGMNDCVAINWNFNVSAEYIEFVGNSDIDGRFINVNCLYRETHSPTESPTPQPSMEPTEPTKTPTGAPTRSPTVTPTNNPTKKPSVTPTHFPTTTPSMSPTSSPTDSPIPLCMTCCPAITMSPTTPTPTSIKPDLFSTTVFPISLNITTTTQSGDTEIIRLDGIIFLLTILLTLC